MNLSDLQRMLHPPGLPETKDVLKICKNSFCDNEAFRSDYCPRCYKVYWNKNRFKA